MTDNDDSDVLTIETVIRDLRHIQGRLEKGLVWSAYQNLSGVRHALYQLQRSCAHKSPRAALHWGNGFRLPDGTIGILRA